MFKVLALVGQNYNIFKISQIQAVILLFEFIIRENNSEI